VKFFSKKPDQELTGQRVVLTSIFVDLLDVVLNGLVAVLTGSVVMLAETFQGFADFVSDTMAYVGVVRSGRAPTKKHPLGFGREIYFWTIMSSLMMFVLLAGLSFYFGYQRLSNPEPIDFLWLSFIILTISVLSNGYSFSLSFRRVMAGRLADHSYWRQFIESSKLESKVTFLSDLVGILSAFLGLVALLLYYFTEDTLFDGLGAIAIGLIMAIFSLVLLFNTKSFVVGKTIPEGDREKIKLAVNNFKEVKKIVYLKATSFGANDVLVHLGINVADGLVTDQIEHLIDEIESNIKDTLPAASHILIELEK